MDIMKGIVSEDILITYFGSTRSGATSRIAGTSTERACQSNWWHRRMETKKKTLVILQHPRSASEYDQNQLIIIDLSKKNEHRVLPKLMITVPK